MEPTASVIVSAIDAIFKLIGTSRSFTGKRRREFFEAVLTPMFAEVEKTHDFFNQLFLKTREAILRLDTHGAPLIGERRPLSLDERETLDAIKDGFMEARQQDEWLRDELRQGATDFFTRISWPEERRFLASVCYYFLGTGGLAPEDQFIDSDVRAVIERGGESHWSTPSVALYLRIRDSRDLAQIRNELDRARNDINQAHMNLRRHYNRVHHAIIMKTN